MKKFKRKHPVYIKDPNCKKNKDLFFAGLNSPEEAKNIEIEEIIRKKQYK